MTSPVTAVPDLSLGARKKHVKRGLLGASVLLCMCVLMYRDRDVCVCGWGLHVSPFVPVYLHISWSLQGPSQGSVHLKIGGLPKQCISYS